MQPREHLIAFARRMIPANTFQSPDKMFAELTGPQREAFVFFLWTEAGKQVERPLPHVDTMKAPDGSLRLAKLGVVGAVRPVGHEIVVLSMPPAINVNEVLFIALVRRATGVSVFFYERCMGNDHATVAANEAVLSEVRADGSRLNHGFKDGIELEGFKQHLGVVLGVSLAGLETSLPPVTMAAFVGAGGAASTGEGVKLGNFLAVACLIAAVAPFVLRIPGLGFLVGRIWYPFGELLAPAIMISLVVWIYQVHAARRGRTSMTPGMAVAWWFVPVANFFMAPATLASAWRGVMGRGPGGLVGAWWAFFILTMVRRNLHVVDDFVDIPIEVVNMIFAFGFVLPMVAFGLLAYIVKTMTSKL